MSALIDLSGKVFDHLRPISFIPYQGWLCKCDCGGQKVVLGGNLRNGRVRSCGCIANLALQSITHGLTGTSEHATWKMMKQRCFNNKKLDYQYYGARGITVCDRWRDSFECFLSDMGFKPSKRHSIDRINNDGNYEPGNCRWATPIEQANNKRPPRRRKLAA